MNCSLDKLVKNLSDKGLKLVKEKGICPDEYINSLKKFNKNKLPDKCNFFRSLKDKCVNEEEYGKSVNVWKVFKMKNLGEYHNLYLKTDVLLSVDVFEIFFETCVNYYRLDPCHYFSSPGLS